VARAAAACHARGVRSGEEEEDREPPTVTVGGATLARLRVGEETPRCDSPCPGCGAYYFELHATGCGYEQCPACGGSLANCGCR